MPSVILFPQKASAFAFVCFGFTWPTILLIASELRQITLIIILFKADQSQYIQEFHLLRYLLSIHTLVYHTHIYH